MTAYSDKVEAMANMAVEYQAHTRSQEIDWSTALWAGVIAGTMFLVLEMIMAPMFTGAPGV